MHQNEYNKMPPFKKSHFVIFILGQTQIINLNNA
jgi:hypothetical protein